MTPVVRPQVAEALDTTGDKSAKRHDCQRHMDVEDLLAEPLDRVHRDPEEDQQHAGQQHHCRENRKFS